MASKALKMIKDNDVKFVDLRFTDTRGKEQHVTLPASEINEDPMVWPHPEIVFEGQGYHFPAPAEMGRVDAIHRPPGEVNVQVTRVRCKCGRAFIGVDCQQQDHVSAESRFIRTLV